MDFKVVDTINNLKAELASLKSERLQMLECEDMVLDLWKSDFTKGLRYPVKVTIGQVMCGIDSQIQVIQGKLKEEADKMMKQLEKDVNG